MPKELDEFHQSTKWFESQAVVAKSLEEVLKFIYGNKRITQLAGIHAEFRNKLDTTIRWLLLLKYPSPKPIYSSILAI